MGRRFSGNNGTRFAVLENVRICALISVVFLVWMLGTARSAQAQTDLIEIEAEVVDTFMGRLGAHEVCITYVENDSTHYGIVESLSECTLATRFESRPGARVRFSRNDMNLITWSEQIDALEEYRVAEYVRVSRVIDLEPRGPGLYARIEKIDRRNGCTLVVTPDYRSDEFPKGRYRLRAAALGSSEACDSSLFEATKVFVPAAALAKVDESTFRVDGMVYLREPLGGGLYGNVDEVFIGQGDPTVQNSSEICVTYLRVFEANDFLVQTYGLVEPFDRCTVGRSFAERLEAAIFVATPHLLPLQEGHELDALIAYRTADYFWLEGPAEELGGMTVVDAREIALPDELAAVAKEDAQLGIMTVQSTAAPFSPPELQAALAEGHRLFGEDCDAVPLEQASFHGPSDVATLVHYLRQDHEPRFASLDDTNLSVLTRFLEREGLEKWRVFYGDSAVHTCGSFRQANYHLLWNTETNQVMYLVFQS